VISVGRRSGAGGRKSAVREDGDEVATALTNGEGKMNRNQAVGGLLAAALVLVAFVAGGAQAASTTHVNCGEMITADTKLANDLTDCPNEGIIIGADNITLDLNGHTIDGDGAPVEGCPADEPCDVGIVNTTNEGGRPVNGPGHSGVTIKNGTVREFDVGVYGVTIRSNRLGHLTTEKNRFHGMLLVRESAHNRIERNTLLDEGFSGIVLDRSDDNRILGNSLSNTGDAIWLVSGSDHNLIEANAASGGSAGVVLESSNHNLVRGNSVSRNVFPGIVVAADDNAVNRNRVSENGDGIIVFGSRNTITDNQVAGAVGCPDGCGFGISLEGGEGNVIARNDVRRTLRDGIRIAAFDLETPTVDTVVRDNRVRDATVDGFSVATEGDGTASGTLIERNMAIGSGDDGFDIRSAATTLTRNTASRNHDLGIEAVPGVKDGGGNKARGNGNPAQCTNVVCKPSEED
jgi:parallel beta-helix repeat protein